ncbi:hypothetical protein IC229_18150 [Spirosoma sp. BT702]|uniref:Uncharacterized protein n=1 Tax=Spirosoma profusum TaxID=2771354 RepID=A0A926Y432_9BACT|nr:hypothetical protein [Spirosoma profusum]MBD2702576.1 hypothetical protein [Spirosoma profusum]
MKNFQFIDGVINFVNSANDQSSEVQVTSIDSWENWISRFKATNEIKELDLRVYDIPLEKFTFFRSQDNNVIAIHLFIKPTANLVALVEADLGNYDMTANWGTEESNDFKIISWNYKRFIVDLRKNVNELDHNLMSLPTHDVITISNDVYRKLK